MNMTLQSIKDLAKHIKTNENGNLVYDNGSFQIELFRYTDPDRLNLADSAALYLGKSDTDNIRRPLNIMKLGHALEVFRGESATFKFYKVSKQVYDHLVTYKTLNMRVAGGNRALVSDTYTVPTDKIKNKNLVIEKIEQSMKNYHDLIEAGEAPQVARSAMPVNANMNPFKLQFNFQTLIQAVFPQRIFEPGAQGLTVEAVKGMFALCHQVDPELWETVYELFGPHTKEWKDVQKKLRKKKTTFSQLLFEVGGGNEYFNELVNNAFYDEEDAYTITVIEGLDAVWDEEIEEFFRKKFGKQKTMW
jgi:hypothetical protein